MPMLSSSLAFRRDMISAKPRKFVQSILPLRKDGQEGIKQRLLDFIVARFMLHAFAPSVHKLT